MELSKKDWLDETFLKSCLSDDPKAPDMRIVSFDVSPGVAEGNNFGSEILRVNVTYRRGNAPEEQVSLIMKAPIHTTLTDFMNAFFDMVEFNFYYKYMPKVREITKVQFAPESYFSSLNSVIVLEDLKISGFEMANRQEQLDFDHCKQYFTKSGQLHAVGVALVKKYPELPEMFPSLQSEFKKKTEKSNVMMRTIIVGLTCLVKSIENLNLEEYRRYVNIIKELVKNDGEKLKIVALKGMNLQSGHFKSLIHGDCWTTNMMFRYDNARKPVDIRLIDFQIFNYDSVVSDVVSFTWMSANNDVLENHLDDLYKLYCSSLNTWLEQLGCEERFSYERLKKEVLDRSFQVLTCMGVFLPLTRAATMLDSSVLFSETVTEDQFKVYYTGESFLSKFPKVVKLAADRGVFDWLENAYYDLSDIKYS